MRHALMQMLEYLKPFSRQMMPFSLTNSTMRPSLMVFDCAKPKSIDINIEICKVRLAERLAVFVHLFRIIHLNSHF